ncbi:hypothetical protein JCM10207_003332 [Rhodosporidiobolus poonsookiae]
MTQLPFPGSPTAAPYAQPSASYAPSGPGEAAASPVPYSPGQSAHFSSPGVLSPVQAYSPFSPSSPFPHQPTTHRSPSLSYSPASPAQHSQPFQPLPADPVLQAHHRSLVAYYWQYAQQGHVAPLTAPEGTDERARQDAARREAVDWAKQCGIAVREPEASPQPTAAPQQTPTPSAAGTAPSRERTTSRPLPAAPASAPPQNRERTTSRPLPVAPSGSSAPPPVPPVPAILPSPLSAAPTKPSLPSLPHSPSSLGRSVSLASPSSPSSPSTLARSVSDAVPRTLPSVYTAPPAASSAAPVPPSTAGKRPLPIPPVVAQVAAQLAGVSISAPQPSPPRAASPAPAVPVIALPGNGRRSPSPVPAPAAPTFSFGDADEPSPAAPAVPSFSFSDPSSPAPPVAPPRAPASAATPAPHPRYDPTHPSHHLYHPTSVSAPLPPPSSSTSSAAPVEAGTVQCASCAAPIFGKMLEALGRTWHPGCFVCAEEGCGVRLDVMEFEGTPEEWLDEVGEDEEEGESEEEGEEEDSSEEEGWVKAPRIRVAGEEGGKEKKKARRKRESLKGKVWCMVHYEERFSYVCHHCRTPIASADYLPITDPLLPPHPSSASAPAPAAPATRYYHPLHFFCAGCGDTFLDPVAYERTLSPSASSTGAAGLEVKQYYARDGHPYCDECDLRMWRVKCPGCRRGIREEDGFLEVPVGDAAGEEERETQKWHEGCFKCSRCTRPLAGIYLLRLETTLVPRTRKQGGGFDAVEEERPYCAECYDVRAKEEAEAAVEAAG